MFRYAVFDRTEQNLLGENMLIARVGPGGLEIGYWTHRDAAGNGFASEATCAIRAADMRRLEREVQHLSASR